jgi:hypothetical protein
VGRDSQESHADCPQDFIDKVRLMQPFNRVTTSHQPLPTIHVLDVQDKHRSSILIRLPGIALSDRASVEFHDEAAAARNVMRVEQLAEDVALNLDMYRVHTSEPIRKVTATVEWSIAIMLIGPGGTTLPAMSTLGVLTAWTEKAIAAMQA